MKRLVLFLLFLSICFASGLAGHTFEDGASSYKKANLAEIMGDNQGKHKALEEAFNIFKSLASKNDYKSLIMYYLISFKLGRPFYLQDDLSYYVKDDHQDFSTIEQMNFYGDDKISILTKLREIARQNEQKAIQLVDEAKNHANLQEYQEAWDKLTEAEKLWDLPEIPGLKQKCFHFIKEKERERIKKQIDDLISLKRYQDALTLLNNRAKGILPLDEMSSLETEIKKTWHDQLLKEAKKESKKNNCYQATNRCDQAYQVIPSNESLKLKKRIQKKCNRIQKKTFWVLSTDIGSLVDLKMDFFHFDWSGNSNQYAAVTDSGSIKGEPRGKKGYNYSFGVIRMFSRSLGILASVSFCEQELKMFTDYIFELIWWDDTSASATGTMSENGKISLTPISLDFLTSLKLVKGLRMNMYAGPTLFMAKTVSVVRVGYGGIWIYGNGIYADWFPFQYEIKESGSYFGGNAGIDLEYKASSHYSAYFGIHYFISIPKRLSLRLIRQSYPGQIWDFLTVHPDELGNLPNYSPKFYISYYKIHGGLKFYF